MTHINIAYTLIAIGSIINLLGCAGILSAKSTTAKIDFALKPLLAGTMLVLIGVFVYYGFTAAGVKALICALFLLITLPAALQYAAGSRGEDKK